MTDPFGPGDGPPPHAPLYAPSGMRLDNTDLTILRLLQTGARGSIQSLAEKIQMSHSGTVSRIRKLEESGAILRYFAEIDETLFDNWRSYCVDIQLSLSGRRYIARVEEALRNAPEIREAHEMLDKFDLRLVVSLPSSRDWHFLRARLDPKSNLFANASHPVELGAVRKRASSHPLLRPGTV